MAGACAAADRYAAGNLDYPRWKLQDSVNQALKEIGEVLKTDITLTTVANQQAYTLPAGVNDVKRVEIASFTAEPYGWIPHAEAGLVGHWKLDEGGTVARDSSGQGCNGTVRGGPRPVPGKIGIGLEFDGNDDVIEVPCNPVLRKIQEGSFTICAWFKPAETPPQERLAQ